PIHQLLVLHIELSRELVNALFRHNPRSSPVCFPSLRSQRSKATTGAPLVVRRGREVNQHLRPIHFSERHPRSTPMDAEAFLHSHDREPALTNPSLRLRLQKPRQTRRLEERASLWGPGSASESPPECPHRLGPLQAGLAR